MAPPRAEMGSVRHFASTLWWQLSMRAGMWVVLLLAKTFRRSQFKDRFHGLFVVNFDAPGDSQDFLDAVCRSLALLQRHDSRRYRRVVQELAVVANYDVGGARAMYLGGGRVCVLRFAAYKKIAEDSGELARDWLLAGSLVHEATHGHCQTRRLYWIPAVDQRIEDLCQLETRRFLRRAATETEGAA